ncbi:SDR family oxidoreductase [Kitasatospora sp. RG8]|uniref:SDR family oxidoreductase n=1 Tax=Kitasatospora sp. RG8 TaxID=2820815 RepID=UPI001AE0625B|nr:SDR family oxidoreductase [Kitasatospora sp. RG8]MBP0454779.1 SDR family oxidoreductase [Kitasatospora sp. RG8]
MPQQTAVVTGAGSGVGRAVAVELAAAGWRLVLAGRREAPLRETAGLCAAAAAGTGGDGTAGGGTGGAAGGAVAVVPTDVTDPAAVDALFATAAERFGRVDLLFNNAGTFGAPTPVDELDVAEWRAVVDLNLTGAFLCARAAFRQMKAQDPQGGRIINNGSISAHVPRPQSIAYTATKHAVTGLTKSLSLDGRPYRIACGQIDIGNAATDMTAAMSVGVRQADGRVAVEPTMDVADVARTVRHMAGLPLEANVQFATVMATAMPYIGRG